MYETHWDYYNNDPDTEKRPRIENMKWKQNR